MFEVWEAGKDLKILLTGTSQQGEQNRRVAEACLLTFIVSCCSSLRNGYSVALRAFRIPAGVPRCPFMRRLVMFGVALRISADQR